MKQLLIIIVLLVTICATSCKKLVEIESPATAFDASKVYLKDATAIGVLTGIYQEMSSNGNFQGTNSISFITGLSADELITYPGFSDQRTAAYQNNLAVNAPPFYGRLYFLIYTCNTAIQGITASTTLSQDVQKRLLGEAKFMRAFFYFYLVNLYGDVPLLLTTDYKMNSLASKSSKEDIYTRIIADLNDAESLLSSDYFLSDLKTVTAERIRPNKWAAKALLARTYLYTKNYEKAEAVASEIISNVELFKITPLNEVFLNTSKECIWQIKPISPSWNTYDARGFVLNGIPNFAQPGSLSTQIMSAFEQGDKRRENWVGSFSTGGATYYYPYKYKVITENAAHTEALTVFRLGEQYLVRAEARAMQGNLSGAAVDLNAIRNRARLENALAATSVGLITAIQYERQVELFTEWGHRWFDLKRTGTVDAVMGEVTPLKGGGTWMNYKALYPIPINEIMFNSNITQNPGY